MENLMKTLASVVPSERQKRWFDTEFYAFAHFGVNTFTNREWGLGDEDEKIFNPVKLDCDQWVEAVKAAGMKGLVLTAKHHDGFCLWPSKYTEHSVKNSPYQNGQGDIVRECADACRRGGIKFGIYLSPWDRNSKYYGTPEYNDYFCNQLTELLTGYGELFHIWFDLACGEGPNGKKQVYDFERYIALIRKYQPNATIFNDHGPDVRWVGNEGGKRRHAEWAVVPHELCYYSEKQTPAMPLCGDLDYMQPMCEDIGNLETVLYSEGLTFTPAEIDMSIRPGWFWHPSEEPHSLERLLNTYFNAVGGNCCLNLNVPPTTDGLIDERDVRRLKEFGELLEKEFANDISAECRTTVLEENPSGQSLLEIDMGKLRKVKYVVLREDLSQGQRIAAFRLIAPGREKSYESYFMGTTVGNKRICPVRFEADKFRIFVTSSRLNAKFLPIEIYTE